MLKLSNDRLCLTVDAAFGARVVELTDLATGRQWLVPGTPCTEVGEDAVYGVAQAKGWDECFPTVLACAQPSCPEPLRDHGALWGRPWAVDLAEATRLETRYETAEIRFVRRLTLDAASVSAEYRVTNLSSAVLPYLWSQHCLLATLPGDRIALGGQTAMRAAGQPFAWPHHPARDLSRVGPPDEGFALKSYADTPGPAFAEVLGPKGGIRLDWHRLPALGIWLCYGGWPEGNPVHQVALEPTTAAADHLAEAEALGQARHLAPGATHDWTVRLTLTAPDERILQ